VTSYFFGSPTSLTNVYCS